MSNVDTDFIQQFFENVEDGNLDRVAEAFADDLVMWQTGRGGTPIDKTAECETLQRFFAKTTSRKYENVRRHLFPGGFVQLHTVRTETGDGVPREVDACVVGFVDQTGRISRIDEFFDAPRT